MKIEVRDRHGRVVAVARIPPGCSAVLIDDRPALPHLPDATRPEIELAGQRKKPIPYDPGPGGWFGNRVVSDCGRYSTSGGGR